jgi:hypothetical protein
MLAADLAPGDAKCATIDWDDFALHRITTRDDIWFETAFGMLWDEFGDRGEMETREVLGRRMGWASTSRESGECLRYDLLLVTKNGEPIAVRDHTAIVIPHFSQAVVHMSHNLVLVPWRRSGIAGWLRAIPVQIARSCIKSAGLPADHPVSLVAEMEGADPGDPARTTRLTAYEKAGYWKIDPSRINYLQPDFRPPDVIDASGGPSPVPLCLLVRRVGKESEQSISGLQVREIAEALYRMYAVEFRRQDMAPLFQSLTDYPSADSNIRLVPPTAT